MSALLAGLGLLGLLLIAARLYTTAQPKSLAKGFRFSAGMALAVVTLGLALTGRLALAFLTAGGAWFLLMGTSPPWQTPWGTGAGSGPNRSQGSGVPRAGVMSPAEALKVLGLEEGASESDIRAAHRRLIQQTHPDKGGSNYLAAKINEAKDVLLKR